MIHLFENETCDEDDVLKLLDVSLDNLNSKYVSKARRQVNKIENILKVIINNDKPSKYIRIKCLK
jgi:hypothetical protein